MPNGDVGIFTPTEAAYTKPGTYEKAIRAEATKRGTYLSSMDQFYAQLEEMERQFGEKLAFEEKRLAGEEKRWGEELAWMREQEAGRLEWEEERETGRLGLERERIESTEDIARMRGEAGVRAARAGRPPGPGEYPGWEREEGITMDWLSQQLEKMYPGEAGTTGHYTGA